MESIHDLEHRRRTPLELSNGRPHLSLLVLPYRPLP